ncbi:hypothetical protein FB99_46990 (plasmid) [Pantoea agglomerans]|nr:hypothetical protein FB99_46990 [Pantoea agglomerans]
MNTRTAGISSATDVFAALRTMQPELPAEQPETLYITG